MSILESEIVNQKKQFIFGVEPNIDHPFPKEEIRFYIYVKNISGVKIENFSIKIEKEDSFFFKKEIHELKQNITLRDGEVKLYDIDGYCEKEGKYYIHFIAFGDETEIEHELVIINCNRIYNSNKLMHRVHIYDFNPYEGKYSLEAEDFNEDVVQTFKRQKLPYKAGESPFKAIKNKYVNNVESESYIDQFQKVLEKHDEHAYHYITRENFTENSLENYSGENLFDIIQDINDNSKYFNATFLRTGNNHLKNDFTRYKPNGLIYRLGLLSSEIFHVLGVIPTFTYMNDFLFRWAPAPNGQHLFLMGEDEIEDSFELIDLYPKQKAMKWGENIWSGYGWNVYRTISDDYYSTDEFKKEFESGSIELRKKINFFEKKEDAEDFIEKNKVLDNHYRELAGETINKYDYTLEQSLYAEGVFFVNIPLDKVPKNFYFIETEKLYDIINRVKPYGMKPIINYVYEETFNIDLDQEFLPEYEKHFEIQIPETDMKYRISENNFVKKNITCKNGVSKEIISEEPTYTVSYDNDFNINVDPIPAKAYFSIGNIINILSEQEYKQYSTHISQDLRTLNDIKELLYNNNYDNISFSMRSLGYNSFRNSKRDIDQENDQYKINYLSNSNTQMERKIDSIKLKIPTKSSFKNNESILRLSIIDDIGASYHLSAHYDNTMGMFYIEQSYENKKGKEFIKKQGYQTISGLVTTFLKYNNKIILIFLTEDSKGTLHYFNHTIIHGIKKFDTQLDNEPYNLGVYTYNQSFNETVTFETPFHYCYENHMDPYITEGKDWKDLFKIKTLSKRYSSLINPTNSLLPVTPFILFYDDINVPETSIIKKVNLKINGETKNKNKITVKKAIGDHYTRSEVEGDSLQLRPSSIESYSQLNQGTTFYKIKRDYAIENDQKTVVEECDKVILENTIFNEDIGFTVDFLKEYEEYINIRYPHWVEIFDFTDYKYNFNNTKNIFLVLEGYNEGNPLTVVAQTASEMNNSNEVRASIPEGYFYKKIPLLYPNKFSLDLFRVRFRFEDLNHNVKIFNTAIDIEFKDKEKDSYKFEVVGSESLSEDLNMTILKDYIYPSDINNGITLEFSFDPLKPGDFYYISSIQLEIVYQDTDTDFMINKSKYSYTPLEKEDFVIDGSSYDAYPSGLFYNDVTTVSQLKSDVGYYNQGFILKDSLFQCFEAREDNITSIEIFPQGTVGNPDENIKIGIYSNLENTPYKLIKEIYANGWVKNNEELSKLNSIKYNLNVNNLKPGEKYWFKIEIVNPKEGSYYILKDVEEAMPQYKLLSRENNNYINTLKALTFNIYSKNLSRSFRDIPAIQDFFNNPYILLGLHRGQGSIKNLIISNWDSDLTEGKHMKGYFTGKIEGNVDVIATDVETGKKKKANFNTDKWDDCNDE